MKSLTYKELAYALWAGILLGLVAGLLLITIYLAPYPMVPTVEFSLYQTIEPIISIPFEIHMTKDERKRNQYLQAPVRVSFYTGLAIENGGYEELNALGLNLKPGSLAAPSDIPFGTTFIINNLPKDVGTHIFSVDDRGGAITWTQDGKMKVDVYVSRRPGESDKAYFRRVNDLGIIYTTALYKLPTHD